MEREAHTRIVRRFEKFGRDTFSRDWSEKSLRPPGGPARARDAPDVFWFYKTQVVRHGAEGRVEEEHDDAARQRKKRAERGHLCVNWILFRRKFKTPRSSVVLFPRGMVAYLCIFEIRNAPFPSDAHPLGTCAISLSLVSLDHTSAFRDMSEF